MHEKKQIKKGELKLFAMNTLTLTNTIINKAVKKDTQTLYTLGMKKKGLRKYDLCKSSSGVLALYLAPNQRAYG